MGLTRNVNTPSDSQGRFRDSERRHAFRADVSLDLVS